MFSRADGRRKHSYFVQPKHTCGIAGIAMAAVRLFREADRLLYRLVVCARLSCRGVGNVDVERRGSRGLHQGQGCRRFTMRAQLIFIPCY